MFHTGLDRYLKADINTFTSDLGIRIRRKIMGNTMRKILHLCTSRKIIVERYPKLDKNKQYIFVSTHSFDEDVISALATIDRNVYMLHGSTTQMLHNPIFLAVWMNGMIYLDRMNEDSRKASIDKMKRVLNAGTSILLFPEGGYNNMENQLVMPLFASPYILSKDLGIEVVPFASVPDLKGQTIHIRVGEPINIGNYEKWEALAVLRDSMATLVYDILIEHTEIVKRCELQMTRLDWMEKRKQVYECQKWYADVWDEEVTYYPGHGVTTPEKSR
ncbi:MAG: 1-acyl-sn-glycerol-3-phosphate acyltransferase, partial [Agathobacter sp.]|nr:1-acyl-sn-glycerol-3-phosphate acyltransferase [Agathobacter sp.]